MTTGMKTIIYPVSDLAQAKAVYNKLLGMEPTHDAPYYVGYEVGDQQLGLDPSGHSQGMTGPIAYWHVDDIKARVQALLDAGAQTQQEIKNVGGGRQIAWLKDADGNSIGLLQDP